MAQNKQTQQDQPRRTMGDMTVLELLKSAQVELSGLHLHLRGRLPATPEGEVDMVKAYVGSISARIENAKMKLGG